MKNFQQLGLSEATLATIQKKGFTEPSEIQEKTIPLVLENKMDIIAQAQTGTGKTAAFALPLLELIDPEARDVSAIILAPTRELVIQICEEMTSLKGKSKISVVPIYGGQAMGPQLRMLKNKGTIVVGTPGRILDHIRRKSLRLEALKFFILDEADEMLNMGFIDDIEEILAQTTGEKRVLLFSATMPPRIKKLAEKYMGAYHHVQTKAKQTTLLIDQKYYEVAQRNKLDTLCQIVDLEDEFYGIVFCRTKSDVDGLSSQLIAQGYSADALHGDIAQAQREKILKKFRNRQTTMLIATDVAARGIDIIDLTHVINYSIPQSPETYTHRIGRTGRAGKEGIAITFVTSSEFRSFSFIKRMTNADIKRERLPSPEEIKKTKQNKVILAIEGRLECSGRIDYASMAAALLENRTPEDVLSATLHHFIGKQKKRSISEDSTKPSRSGFSKDDGKTRLFVARGTRDNLTKSGIVDFIVKKTAVPQRLIRDVSIHENFSFISVPAEEAEIILKKFQTEKDGRKALVVKAKAL